MIIENGHDFPNSNYDREWDKAPITANYFMPSRYDNEKDKYIILTMCYKQGNGQNQMNYLTRHPKCINSLQKQLFCWIRNTIQNIKKFCND